jgi:hypothetical protein
MGDFNIYLPLGWGHIIGKDALDHQLFILVLAALYRIRQWRQLLVLVTAFTIGHSLTLALSVYNLVRIPTHWVEFFIPCTIMAAAVFNLLQKDSPGRLLRFNYLLALLFGLVHGLGFANSIRMLLASGQDIGWPLLGFNIGLELGQLAVVCCILLLTWAVVDKARLPHRWWVWLLSGIGFIWAAIFALQRLP